MSMKNFSMRLGRFSRFKSLMMKCLIVMTLTITITVNAGEFEIDVSKTKIDHAWRGERNVPLILKES